MLILALDTATPWGTMALCQDRTVLAEVAVRMKKGGGEYLLALLPQLLSKTGQEMEQLELLVVGTGPGSYTGIRVGLAAIKGLAAGLAVPVRGVSTLQTIAANARYAGRWVAAALDARRGEVYGCLYENTELGPRATEPARVWSIAEWAPQLAALPSEVIVCGDGGKVGTEVWERHPNLTIAPSAWDRPLASLAAELAWQQGEEHPDLELAQLKPTYLRRVEAELRWEAQHHGD